MNRMLSIAGIVMGIALHVCAAARADAVTDWNAIANEASVIATAAGRPGPVGALDLAMTQAAVHNAVQAIERRYRPYRVSVATASGSSSAATAKAAHDVLVALFPAQTASLDAQYRAYLASRGLSETDPGVAVGRRAAADILALRANDGRFPSPPPPAFMGSETAGKWRPTASDQPVPPPSFAPGAVPWLANVTPFVLVSPSQLRAGPPPALRSSRYARDYDEVKALGSLLNSARTPAQTELANFYTDNPVALWNRAMRMIATTHLTHIADSARLFALANLATADGVISAWDSKYHYVFWRPITAIREGDNDGNPRTTGDAAWSPFLNTPNYPDYTSGMNNISGAMSRTLALFFGKDRFPFAMTSASPRAVPPTRIYDRFSDAARDVVDVRVYQGIHFRFADTAARKQGSRAAEWAFRNFLRPLRDDRPDGPHDDDWDDGDREGDD